MGFQGNVESFSLADVFQNLSMNQQTGTLRLWEPEGQTRHIFFEDGQVKYIAPGDYKPLYLGNSLIARGVLTEEQIQEALAREQETGQPLAECIVELGHVDRTNLEEQVRHKLEEGIYELFYWEKAQFEFVDGPPDEELFRAQAAATGGVIPIAHLIMEAARRIDEWDQIKQQLPSLREIFVVSEMATGGLESGEIELEVPERRVLSLMDGTADVEDLIDLSLLFRFEVLKAVSSLIGANLIRPATVEELTEATSRLEGPELRPRLCKVLDRRVACGDDRPEIRRALADALAEEGQNQRASIHYHVLVEEALQAGNEEEGVQLLKRILAIMPNHLPSRGQLGAIYAKRNQNQEAIIQYRELFTAYKESGQLAEARAACERALECDETQIAIRHELMDIYLAEGDKMNAAKQSEIKGDQLAKTGQVPAAADAYRKAMQLVPGQSHLKRKLADVQMSEGEKRARKRRTIALVSVGVVSVLAALLFLGHEYKWHNMIGEVQAEGVPFLQQAEDARGLALKDGDPKHYQVAAEAYGVVISFYEQSGLLEAATPLFGTGETARETVEDLRMQRDTSIESFEAGKKAEWEKSKVLLGEAKKLQEADLIFQARDAYKSVIDNPYAGELKDEARVGKRKVDSRIEAFEKGKARVSEAFNDARAEYDYKVRFLDDFRRVPKVKEVEVELPVQVTSTVDDVEVRLDGALLGKARRGSGNVFRYPSNHEGWVSFTKPGFETVKLSTSERRPSLNLVLARKRDFRGDLGESLSGNPYNDGQSVWMGTANGGILKLDIRTLKPQWPFVLPGGGFGKGVSGDIERIRDGADSLLIYSTADGDCVGVISGQKRPKWHRFASSKLAVPVSPVFMTLPNAPKAKSLVAADGKQLIAIDPLTGKKSPLGKKPFTAPRDITTAPVPVPDSNMIIFGCADRNLYAVDASTGLLLKSWAASGEAPIVGTPVIHGKHLIAGVGDELQFFELGFKGKSGFAINRTRIGGRLKAKPVVKDGLLYLGCAQNDGLFIVDLTLQTLLPRPDGTKRSDGAVLHPPAFLGNRVYFGTREGYLFALERRGTRHQLIWKVKTRGIGGLAGRPLILGRRVIFFMASGRIYGFDE